MNDRTRVVIAGAGPTGLLLAGDLAAAGVPCVVLERRNSGSNLTRAFAVHARTLEMLDARGIADSLIATGTTVPALRLFDKVEIDFSALPTRFPFVLITPQSHTERLLEERATNSGVEIVRGATVGGLRQDAGSVTVDVRMDDGRRASWQADYLVGADGVHSAVRGSLGLPFPGHSAVRSVMLADVRLKEAPVHALVINAVKEGFAFIVPFGDGWYRVIAWDRRHQKPDSAPVELDEVRDITRLALRSDFGMHEARWLSRFHSDERQVASYRAGRVFLAGDAAHVHSPAGGQGMNVGLLDAANLGWKLAAAVHGWAPAGLLDTYHQERHEVGQDVLRGSGFLLRLAMLRPWPLRISRRVFGRALLGIRPINRRAAGMASGIDISYSAPSGAHATVGERAPDTALKTGRLHEALRSGRFVLLARGQVDLGGWAGRVDLVIPADDSHPVTLVRPDGYVAWASDETDPPRCTAAIQTALAAWCGTSASALHLVAAAPEDEGEVDGNHAS